MSFHARLLEETASARQHLLTTPIIQGALRGEVSLPSYLAFLREAYHHVRHTVPLLHAMKAALPDRLDWLQPALDEYIEEEAGHDEWILNDIRACGGDADKEKENFHRVFYVKIAAENKVFLRIWESPPDWRLKPQGTIG